MKEYPYIVWENECAEIIACAPHRFRLLWNGRYVAKFCSFLNAGIYYQTEFESFPSQPL